jgi:hypothetical protein
MLKNLTLISQFGIFYLNRSFGGNMCEHEGGAQRHLEEIVSVFEVEENVPLPLFALMYVLVRDYLGPEEWIDYDHLIQMKCHERKTWIVPRLKEALRTIEGANETAVNAVCRYTDTFQGHRALIRKLRPASIE